MSTPDGRVVTKAEVTTANRISDLAPHVDRDGPKQMTGISLVDHGSVCEGLYDEKCFLNPQQRTDLLVFWVGRVNQAYANYMTAIAEVRVDELLKKEESNAWLISLLLDVAGAQIISVVAKQIIKLKADALTRWAANASHAASKNAKRAQVLLSGVSDKQISSGVKQILDLGRKEYAQTLTHDSDRGDEKSSNTSMLKFLQKQAGAGFEAIREQAPGTLTDADFIVLVESFADANHDVAGYVAGLKAKLARFNSSGITKLGRSDGLRDVQIGHSNEAAKVDVVRHSRLVWLRYPNGRMELRFQTQDGAIDPSVVEFGDPGTGWTGVAHPNFGPSRPIDDAPRLGDAVPAEFIEVAMSRHVQAWGRPPLTVEMPAKASPTWFAPD